MKQLNPTPAAVAVWLKQLNRTKLHEQGWIEINKRFHGIAFAVRPFLQEHFPDKKEREAAYDGLTLALATLAHFEEVERLAKALTEPAVGKPTTRTLPAPVKRPTLPDKT